jgi:(p)ppGpp synthase/HD superfamily hydrolase
MTYLQLDSAIAFAATAHAGQLRKYDGLPYIVHPIEVMTILHQTASIVTEDQLCAAVLHDVVEDTSVNIDTIRRRFGTGVADLVFELTDQFVLPEQGNRAARKAAECARLACISPAAQSIKYADLISNTRSIVEHDAGFARTYLDEKERILKVMIDGDVQLYHDAIQSLVAGQESLVRRALARTGVSSDVS